jgi:hypothetical protein
MHGTTHTPPPGSCLSRTCLNWTPEGELSSDDLQQVLERLAAADGLPQELYHASTNVRIGSPVAPPRPSSPAPAPHDAPPEEWPHLDQDRLLPSRSRQVCLTCHWFRHHAGPGCVPLLTCQLHQGLIAHGDHLTHRCASWTDDQVRQRGWAPEVA